ncbi:MAG: serine/threonine protein kinase [Nannocystaceae bacterium]|nr:serine/threonine protein kinase [Nannocystaceae bacterium]
MQLTSETGDGLTGSSPFDWMAEGDGPGDAPDGDARAGDARVAERLALARVTQGLLGRRRWPELGRYEIARRLGKGAFGSVLLARDPKLDRDVAIKIVSLPSGDHAAARGRVTREARALAALTHPGVVQVYDFGLVQDEMCRDAHGEPGALYIVMEYLRGSSVRAWLTEGNGAPAATDILLVVDRVARALAAVHAAGLVHRDIKPDNIMLTHDGLPKLVDFGLVRTQEVAGSLELQATEPMAQLLASFGDSHGAPVPSQDPSPGPSHGTAAGTILGTPQYMAPEQHEGRLATAACDQFALAATLFEALACRLPFGGGDLDALLTRKLDGVLPTAARPIAPAVLRVIQRALSRDPTDRFPTIEQFRRALAEAAAPRRRSHWIAGAIGLAALVPLGVVWGGALEETGGQVPCPTDALFSNLHRVGSGSPGGEDPDGTQAKLAQQLDAYASDWSDARDTVCEHASSVNANTQTRRVACLERTAMHARTWLDAVLPSSGLTSLQARRDVSQLPDPAACTDAKDDLLGLNAAQRAAVAGVELRLHRLEARFRVNVTPEAVEQALAALATARTTGHLPLVAQALGVAGQVRLDLGHYAEADALLTEAVLTSLSAQRANRAARLMPRLMDAREQTVGPTGIDALIPLAARVLALPDAPAALRARIGVNLGFNLLGRNRFEAAQTRLHEVKAMLEAADATVSREYGDTLTALSSVARNQGRLDDALELASTALAVLELAEGPQAPSTAFAHERLGAIHRARGEHKQAAQRYETAIRLLQTTYGPHHPDLAWPRSILAVLWAGEGRLDEAVEAADWALKIAEASAADNSEMIAVMTFNRSVVAEKRGNLDAAIQLMRRNRAICVAVAGENGENVATADMRIGELLRASGKHQDAIATLEHAWAHLVRLDRPEDIAACRWYLAQALSAQGRRDDAVVHAKAALAALPREADERAEVEAFLSRATARNTTGTRAEAPR